jgi:enolase-phosphatase E1
MIRAILTDIEGTTTPISFVTKTLYPYARARLSTFLRDHARDAEVEKIIAEVKTAIGEECGLDGVIAQLLAWMDADRKAAPLKDMQGIIWEQGYAEGALVTEMYKDAARWLRQWLAAGLRLYVFSSGSVRAQKAIFAHTDQGNVGALFSGYFDTRIGHKRMPEAYTRIAGAIGLPAAEVLFLSDVREELDAARRAGMQTTWLVRDRAPAGPAAAHRQARDFAAVRL